MIKIGIIGNIGAGKSYVAKQFRCPIFDADLEVKKIYKKNKLCYKKLKKKFPKYILSFPINKNELGNAIISNKKNIKKIIKIVHPLVRIEMKKFFKKYKNNKIVILDVPLLLENKLNKNYVLVYVDAKQNDILKRLKKRPNYNPKIFSILKKIQLPLEYKRNKSDYIIKNNFKKFYGKKSIQLLKKKILNYERSNS